MTIEFGECYNLNVCVPPKFTGRNPNPQGGNFKEVEPLGGVLMNGIRANIKDTPGNSLLPSVL